jgi:hypothetical protein
MITGAFISLAFAIMTFFISVLPVGSGFSAPIVNAFGFLEAPLASVAWFLPVTAMLYVLVSAIAVRLILFLFHVYMFIWAMFRGGRPDRAR